MNKPMYLLVILLLIGGCSSLKDAAIGALTGGSSGGIEVSPSVEVIDGDKQETIEVAASKTETNVSAANVNEVSTGKQEAQRIVNQELSGWTVFLISSGYILSLIFWALPTPNRLWRAFQEWRK